MQKPLSEALASSLISSLQLLITQGPLRGSHALVLKPFTKYFRFLELPLEIRRMIYDELLLEAEPIQINSYKDKDEPRRATGLRHYSLPGSTARYAARFRPNSLAIMTVNRQMLQEASATMYSGNTFRFDKFSTCQIFLTDLGTMRGHIRHISFSGWAYQKTKARGMFFKLKDAIGLRSISLHYMDFANWTADTLAADCKTMMTALQRSRKGGSNVLSVLDILKLTFSKCTDCDSPKEDGILCTGCMKRSEKSSDLQGQIRQAVAEKLGLEE